ncbi:hypothetical protein [Marinomonas epiphytica]
MTQKNVADALNVFYELKACLENAYWESNDINQKDRFFSMDSMLQDELDELHKLSLQDHVYPYEAINPSVVQLKKRLSVLLSELDNTVYRPTTFNSFAELIPRAIELFEN